MAALVHHETGHREMALQTAEALVREVNAILPAPTCLELDREIKRVCNKRIDWFRKETEAYDEGTEHGATQGAVLE